MNTEKAVATDSQGSFPTNITSQTHFGGFQVGSDLGVFNVQNSGWNLHGGVTGGDYDVSIGDEHLGASSASYNVPFLGLYVAVLGHGFFADLMVRHDFWDGAVTSGAAGLVNARQNGNANALTAEAGYTYHFENRFFATGSLGFLTRTRPSTNLIFLPGTLNPPSVSFGNVKSDLGRAGLTIGRTFATEYWALTPNVTGSVWHEFAGEDPSTFAYGSYVDNVSVSRLGTFGQIGVGLVAQPIQNLNYTGFIRADFRTGSNIYGGTITAGFRYQF